MVPEAVDHTGGWFKLDKMLNDLGIILTPSVAFIVKVYVVCEEIFGNVPEITPVVEFNVTPEGKDEPEASAYVTVESESAEDNADRVMLTCSVNVPNDPLAVTHTGLALTYSASGINPNRFEGFVTFMSYGSLAFERFANTAVSCTKELYVVDCACTSTPFVPIADAIAPVTKLVPAIVIVPEFVASE